MRSTERKMHYAEAECGDLKLNGGFTTTHKPYVTCLRCRELIAPTPKENDAPVPESELLACTLWKCYRNATQGIGDGSVTWWTIQPIERAWWKLMADNFRKALIAHPDLLPAEERDCP